MFWRYSPTNSYIDSFLTYMSIALDKLWWSYDLIPCKITRCHWQFLGDKFCQLLLIRPLAINLIKVYTSQYFRCLIKRRIVVRHFFFHTLAVLCLTSTDIHSLWVTWYCAAISPAVNFSIKQCIRYRLANDAGVAQFNELARLSLILLVEVLLQKF